MKILLTADPEIPVPPRHYGGIERVVHLLADGLIDRGHDVTLIAHPESRTKAKLVPYSDADWRTFKGTLAHASLVTTTVWRGSFDFVHSHSRIAYLAAILPMRVPKLMSYQRSVTPRSINWATRIAGQSIAFSAVSRSMTANVATLTPWRVVYNGVPVDAFTFTESIDASAPLVFLGRVEPIKGAHLAIRVAHRSNRKLVIAGNIPDEYRGYFESEIAPHVDGNRVQYVGPVDDRQKNDLLGRASAFLMPILWEEPFGIVMAEALACGTPVIGLRRGSVPEVIDHGKTGFICDDEDEMVEAVMKSPSLDRKMCRSAAEQRFSERSVVDGFLSIYESMLADRKRS